MRRRPRRLLPLLLGGGLLLVAGAVTAATPPEAALLDPFPIGAADDGKATSRTLEAAVVDATRTERVTMADGDWEAEGDWLVIELAVSAPTTEVDAAIGVASLMIDGRLFQASERPPATLVGTDLRVGTDTVGMLAFELPAGLRSGTGELRLSGRYPTPELDDVIVFSLDLEAVPSTPSVEIDAPRLGAP